MYYSIGVFMLISCSDYPYNIITPISTGKHTDKCARVTHEMASHGVLLEDLENIVSNPSQTEWRLKSTPSVQLYLICGHENPSASGSNDKARKIQLLRRDTKGCTVQCPYSGS